MKISITTTKTHRATITADQLKTVALAAVKKDAKLADGVETKDSVEFGSDGSMTVEVVEPVVDSSEDVDAEDDKSDASALDAPKPTGPAIPTSLSPSA